MADNNTFGKKLKHYRKIKALTQEKLAELAGVNEKHISKLELGTYKPTYATLEKIYKALDLNIEHEGIEFKNVSANDNPFYIKSMQISSNADDEELEYYYSLLRAAQKGSDIFKNKIK